MLSDANPGRRGGKPAINRLSYGTAFVEKLMRRNMYAAGERNDCGYHLVQVDVIVDIE
jgi:hypothetical protein